MRTPIAYTLAWPERMASPSAPLDFATLGSLDFEAPDLERFPAMRLARECLAANGAAPAVMNAANEVSVAAFLNGTIGFLDIAAIVERVLARYSPDAPTSIDEVIAIDGEARRQAARAMEAMTA